MSTTITVFLKEVLDNVRDRRTREERAEAMDEELDYGPNQLDRDVVAPDQIRTVVRAYRDRLFTEIYPGREIETGILWTRTATYMSLPHSLVNEALARSSKLDVGGAAS